MEARLTLETVELGRIVRSNVDEICSVIEDVIQDVVKETQQEAKRKIIRRLDELLYKNPKFKPKHYKYTGNLAKAATVSYEKLENGAVLWLWSDSDKVQVKRARQPKEEIPLTIETGKGYPDPPATAANMNRAKKTKERLWYGPTQPRPYMSTAAESTMNLIKSRLEAAFRQVEGD